MIEYRVLSERDGRFSGNFDPTVLEDPLNSYAAEGWRVVQSFLTASVWKSTKAEIVVILERSRNA
ncbi:MAG TPA: DUF4177 domain-containing protein [Jatrophihabitantaceae bacterium]|jgi:hypothetical protein